MSRTGRLLVLCLALFTTGAQGRPVVLVAGGDVMLGRNLVAPLDAYGPGYPFARVRQILDSADIAFANLESPVTDCPLPFPRAHHFPAPPRRALSLQRAGFDVVSLANNHALDCGSAGLVDTAAQLRALNIAGIGIDRDGWREVCVPVPGRTVCFLAFSQAVDPAWHDAKGARYLRLDDTSLDRIRDARSRADIVVVSLHWGVENGQRRDAGQVTLARRMIDAGAMVVLGHGSHTAQEIEPYRHGLIVYSLGNLLFDQYGREGSLVTIRIDDRVLGFDRLAIHMERGQVAVQQEENTTPASVSQKTASGNPPKRKAPPW